MKPIEDVRRQNLARAIADLLGGNQTAAALRLGYEKPTLLNHWLAGRKNISTPSARKIETGLGLEPFWLDADHPNDVKPVSDERQPDVKRHQSSSPAPYNVTHLPETRIAVGESSARRVYVVGRANGGLPERIWTDGGYLVGATEEYAIQATDDPLAFLTPIVGTSMSPVYNPGDFAFVEPSTEVEAGDDVLVRLATGETLLKRLRSSHDGVQLESYNEPGTLFFKPEEITWIYYVAHPVRRKKIKTRF